MYTTQTFAAISKQTAATTRIFKSRRSFGHTCFNILLIINRELAVKVFPFLTLSSVTAPGAPCKYREIEAKIPIYETEKSTSLF